MNLTVLDNLKFRRSKICESPSPADYDIPDQIVSPFILKRFVSLNAQKWITEIINHSETYDNYMRIDLRTFHPYHNNRSKKDNV